MGITTKRSALRAASIAVVAMLASALIGSGVANAAPQTNIAFLSFAVANSYDKPMLDAAKAEARKAGAKLTVFDANNDYQKQYQQLQNVITSKKYQGVIIQPIYGANLVPLVQKALRAKIKVVNIDQILGSSYTTTKIQVAGLHGNVVFNPVQIATAMANHVVNACKSLKQATCEVGYLWSLKVSSLDVTMKKVFDGVIAKATGVDIKIVAEGESYWTPTFGLSASQNMLQSNPEIDVIVGADQGIQGAELAVAGAGKAGKVLLVGYGGSQIGISKVRLGAWYGTVMQAPASTGRLGMQALLKAIKTGKGSGVINPIANFPDKGVVTKANASKFKGEWAG